MPVAKLSREFYDRFGDKVTDELVSCLNSIEESYRAELRDLFAVHFGRFEEKLERRLGETAAEGRAEMREALAKVRAALEEQMAKQFRWLMGGQVTALLAVIGVLAGALFAR